MFLLGLWTGRERIPHHIDENKRFLRRVAAICLPVGIVVSLLWMLMPDRSTLTVVMRAGAPGLTVCLASTEPGL